MDKKISFVPSCFTYCLVNSSHFSYPSHVHELSQLPSHSQTSRIVSTLDVSLTQLPLWQSVFCDSTLFSNWFCQVYPQCFVTNLINIPPVVILLGFPQHSQVPLSLRHSFFSSGALSLADSILTFLVALSWLFSSTFAWFLSFVLLPSILSSISPVF